MIRGPVLGARVLVLIPLLLVLIIAVACGDDATPQPAPTADVAAIRAAVQEAVGETLGPEALRAAIAAAIAETAPAVSAEEIQEMVQAAVGAIPTGLSAEEILAIVQTAVPEGASIEEIQSLVETAVAAAAEPALTKEDIERLVSTAADAAAKGQLTAREVEAIVKAAIPHTPTPVPTPLPTATPGFFTSSVDRLVQVVEAPLGDSIVPWRLIGGVPTARPNFEALLSTDPWTAEFVPQLATEWVMSPNAKDWTMTLHENVPFSFGFGEFTSVDVRHTWERNTSEESITSGKSLWADTLDSAQDIELVNDHKVIFHMNRPNPSIWPRFSNLEEDFLITSKAQWDKEGAKIEELKAFPSTTAPWILKDRVLGDFALFERVENHWRLTPQYNELLVMIVEEPATQLAMLLAGETHMAILPKDLQPQALNRGMQRLTGVVPSGTAWLFFFGGLYFSNPELLQDLPWENVKVRAAMNKAINRQELIDTIYDGRATIATHHGFQPGLDGWDPQWAADFDDLYGYDPEGAKMLLAEAGFPDGFDMKIWDWQYSGAPELNQIFEAMALYWDAIGINAKLVPLDYATARPNILNKTAHGFIGGWPSFGRYEPDVLAELMHHGQEGAFVVYSNPVMDGIIDELKQTVNRTKRTELKMQIGDILFREYSIIPMVHTFLEIIINPDFVAAYPFPGNYGGGYTHTEYIEAAK